MLLRYIDYNFFICAHSNVHLEVFSQELNNLNPNLKITYESNEKEIPILKVNLNENTQY